jgi:hypothetical protein
MKTAVKTTKDRPPRLSRQFLRDMQWVADHMNELVEKYPNQWIAVHKGEVIAQGEEAFDVWQNAGKLGLGQPYLWLVEKGIHVY